MANDQHIGIGCDAGLTDRLQSERRPVPA
jgi:hypothetical protein